LAGIYGCIYVPDERNYHFFMSKQVYFLVEEPDQQFMICILWILQVQNQIRGVGF
jgi:hypothetical protein